MSKTKDLFAKDLDALAKYVSNYMSKKPHFADYEFFRFVLKQKEVKIDEDLPNPDFDSKNQDNVLNANMRFGPRRCRSQSGLTYETYGVCHNGDRELP